MPDPLERPVWAALTGRHEHLGKVRGQARRYQHEVNVFVAGPVDDDPQVLADMAALVDPGEAVFVVQAAPIPDLPGLTTVLRRPAVQMVFAGEQASAGSDEAVVELGANDAEDMVALATLTEPGPFRRETYRMGRFVGVRSGGRLVAMAGERMRLPGMAEVSGVCTHPDARGQGLATRLSAHVVRVILARGEVPFLHVWKSNTGAIGLYEKLGFAIEREMAVAVFERRAHLAHSVELL